MKAKRKIMLIIRDGWGYRKSCTDNAICQAPTTKTDELMKKYPHVLINAAGEAAGLPDGYQGNSEVGHLTIGSGRIIFQSMMRINKAITDGSFFKNDKLLKAIANCKQNDTPLHLIGLLQAEGVHSHIDHLFALLDLCKQENFNNVLIHLITDGRDAPVHASLKHIKDLQAKFAQIGFGQIATVSGRYYAMDRDKRWDRTQKAYDCVVEAKTQKTFENILDYIKICHDQNETDEFIIPAKASWYQGWQDGHSVIFYNFRIDRPRQFTQAVVEDNFKGFKRQKISVFYVTMTQFYEPMKAEVAFDNFKPQNFLGQVIAENGLSQLRISETEKYAHVTFFFNGQIEEPNKNEDRILIPSPKVTTYDKKPEMSVYEIKDEVLKNLTKKDYDLIVMNLVNSDMVGHTGLVPAIKKAVVAVDDCIGEIINKALVKNYTILVFADHGNAEDQTSQWQTSHTTNPVPLILISNDKVLQKAKLKKNRGLRDIAPTTLKLMGLKKPAAMTGESLIIEE